MCEPSEALPLRPVALAILLAALTVLPALPTTTATDDCASAAPKCVPAPVSVPCPVSTPACISVTLYVYAAGGTHVLYQESNGLAGLQRTASNVGGHTYPPDTLIG